MIRRLYITLRGAVQGVGFRPFVHALARECSLFGYVTNTPQGVIIEVEGEMSVLSTFRLRLEAERPAHSYFHSVETAVLDPLGFNSFEIRESEKSGLPSAVILPDIATCPECLQEILDASNSRYLYPFTNCTHCGPRFSIITALPYDRDNTTMRAFTMCPECTSEYRDPANRRFHAQPNACPSCGPHITLTDKKGRMLADRQEAIQKLVDYLKNGSVVAVKGLGGFHLMVDATDNDAVMALRERKRREQKPLAVMFPSLEELRKTCVVSELEAQLLRSPQSPIVLVDKRDDPAVELSGLLAPHNPRLGAMLPYTPLHYILLREAGIPLVATSGNLTDEPICTDEQEALVRLDGIADVFLVHNRPIARHIDDSVVRVVLDGPQVLRRARGYAPLPVARRNDLPQVLAVGAHQKNAIALCRGDDVFVSQHIGDLETPEALSAFERAADDLASLYDITPEVVAADAHPDYLSTQYAVKSELPVILVQHHKAHVLSCIADNELEVPVLGVSWDGTGLGDDGIIWGGEFFWAEGEVCSRVATFRTFRLPGNAQAVKEPRRVALGVLYELFGDDVFERGDLRAVSSFSDNELRLLRTMLARGVNSPVTSSAGRLFDAVASLSNLVQRIGFEGQAAMMLEGSIGKSALNGSYEFWLKDTAENAAGRRRFITVDWAPIILGVLKDVAENRPVHELAAKFHNTLADVVVELALLYEAGHVCLTGGCFQNKFLTLQCVNKLRRHGVHAYWHQRVPPNDGGIALGQIVAAQRALSAGHQTRQRHAVEV